VDTQEKEWRAITWDVDEAEQLLKGNVPPRVLRAVLRAYGDGMIRKPLRQCSNFDLLQVPGIGDMALKIIRAVIPEPPRPPAPPDFVDS
jgi:hypothetical protein